MTLLLKQIFDFIRLLNSDKGTNQIASGVACGMILGFTPAFSLQTLLVFVILFFFRIQIGAALLTAVFFKLFAFLLDPVFDQVGGAVLSSEGLRPLFTTLYNAPVIPFTRFNDSIVMGSGVVALALAIPVFFLSRTLIGAYRVTVVARFERTRFWKVIQSTKFYNWYLKYEQFKG